MPADRFKASVGPRGVPRQHPAPEAVPDLFETGTERLPSSGQFSAATIAGLTLFATELLVAPLVFCITLVASLLFWWLLDQPWSGRRRRTRRRGITSRLLYLSTLLLTGMWLSVMFVFRASDPTLSAGFTSTLPSAVLGVDISMLTSLNGMRTYHAANVTVAPPPPTLAPFSLFAHGTASTIAISLLAYAVVSGRRRKRRRLREEALRDPRTVAASAHER
jgi:peptidoglycan/LPS O-acetylase OafA/YrhL